MRSNSGMAALATAVEQLAGEELDGADPDQLAADLRGLHTQVARLQAQLVRRLGAFDAVGGAEQVEHGAATTRAELDNLLLLCSVAATCSSTSAAGP